MSKYDYDVIVIGGGAAGLTSAGMAASFGAKTALVESKQLGGDCTWYGCVPSKALLKAAKVLNTIKTSEKYGIKSPKPEIDIKEILNNVHKIQHEIYNDADHPDIYKNMGIDVLEGSAEFINPNSIKILKSDSSTKEVSSKYIFIATGSSPTVPPISGINDIKYLTNENIFSIEKLPEKLTVIGGGPIGLEMAQAFSRLSSGVTVVDHSKRILNKDDAELAELMKLEMEKEGITFNLGYSVDQFIKENDKIITKISDGDDKIDLVSDEVLISVGRKPTIDKLNLDTAGINYDKRGIKINESCRTNVDNIFAVGDCAGTFQFTHYAEHMAKKAVSTALLKIPFKIEPESIIWSTYTDHELAHVGLTAKQLEKRNIKYKTYKFPFSKIDRAITESSTIGWIKVYAKEFNGKIYGVDIFGKEAGEMINEFALAIKNNISLRKMADTIHAYPTYMLGNRRTADQWYIQKQSRTFVNILMKLFGYRGQLPDTSDPDRII